MTAPSRLSLAISILRLTAQDQGKTACVHTENDAVCTLRSGHGGEHVYESINKVIPIE